MGAFLFWNHFRRSTIGKGTVRISEEYRDFMTDIFEITIAFDDKRETLRCWTYSPIALANNREKQNNRDKEHDLPEVVFHSLRHSSITYKLKLAGCLIYTITKQAWSQTFLLALIEAGIMGITIGTAVIESLIDVALMGIAGI